MASQVPPKKGAAFTVYFDLRKYDGSIIANPGTITKRISKDGGSLADTTNSITEIDNTYGLCSIVLTATEMTADAVWLYIIDNTSGCVPFTITIYTSSYLNDDIASELAKVPKSDGSVSLNSTVLAAIADAAADEVYEGTITLRQAVKLFLAVLTGKSSGGGTSTLVFRDIGDTKNRISVTVDDDGNRTAVGTRDGS